MEQNFNKPWLSVVVAVYNAESFIARCLDSIIRQSYADFEVVIVDDGSTDSSLSIAKYYEKIDERIRVYAHTHEGAYKTKITAFNYAQGLYIISCDADDYFVKNAFLHLHQIASGGEHELVQFTYYNKYKHLKFRNKVHYGRLLLNAEEFKGQYEGLISEQHNQIMLRGTLWCKLYHRRLLQNIPPMNKLEALFMGDDFLLNLYLLRDCKSALFLNKPLYVYCCMSGNSARFHKGLLEDTDYVRRNQFLLLNDMKLQIRICAERNIFECLVKDVFYFTISCFYNLNEQETEMVLGKAFALPTFIKAAEYFRNRREKYDLMMDAFIELDAPAYIKAAKERIPSKSLFRTAYDKVKYFLRNI